MKNRIWTRVEGVRSREERLLRSESDLTREGGRGGGSVENNTNTSRRSGRASFPMTITIIPRLALLQSIT